MEAQKNVELLRSYLRVCRNYGDIEKFYQIIGKHTVEYSGLINNIPSFSPLNPIKTKRVSDKFGERFHPIDGVKKKHLGIDISANYGTPVHSTAEGYVKVIQNSESGYGKQIEIQHDYGFETKYAHLYSIIVKPGQKIKKGDIIGFVGSTGHSTGSHLHFEIKKNNVIIDPFPFLFLYKYESN